MSEENNNQRDEDEVLTSSETVKRIIEDNNNLLLTLIDQFGDAPKNQIDEAFQSECRGFDKTTGDPVQFLRDLQDKMVYAGGCSDFVIKAVSAALSFYPEEDPKKQALRRANLSQQYGKTE